MATIQTVNSDDSPNEGRVRWNDNDDALNDDIIADSAALTTHKTSSDHDSRYYTETEVTAIVDEINNDITGVADDLTVLDAEVMKITGDQTVAGEKTFTGDVAIKKTAPTLELINSDESLKARLQGYNSGDDRILVLQMEVSPGNYEDILRVKKGGTYVDFPDRDFFTKGEKGATEDYVQRRLKSGTFVLSASLTVASLAGGTSYYFKNHNGNTLRFGLAQNCALIKSILNAVRTSNNAVMSSIMASSYVFTNIGVDAAAEKWLIPKIETQAVIGGVAMVLLKLYSGKNVGGTLSLTEIYSDAIGDAATSVEWTFELSMILSI